MRMHQVCAVTLLQVVMAWAVRDQPWWKVLVAAYVVGGTASQNLFTAQHELSHFLAFRTPLYNKVLSIASNCPLVVPTATSFRKYHQEHHSHLVRVRCALSRCHLECVFGTCMALGVLFAHGVCGSVAAACSLSLAACKISTCPD
jgi:hypothetical protein